MYVRVRIFALAVLILVLSGTAVIASDISDAEYKGTIAVSNNSTATTEVSTVFALNTASLISTQKLNATATDAAIQVSGGTDVPFMPGYGGNPWATYVPTIGEDETRYQYLYTSGVSGGELHYFPGSGGMTTTDSATLEPGSDFEIEQSGYIDTSSGSNKNLFYKYRAVRIYINSANSIRAAVLGSDWSSPTGFVDGSGNWSDETNAYDENTGTYASAPIAISSWGEYLELTHASLDINGFRYYGGGETASITQIDVDVYYSSAWHDVYEGAFTQGTWETKSHVADGVTSARVRFYNADGADVRTGYLYEFDFQESVEVVNVTATGVSSGEHTVKTTYDGVDLEMFVDDMVTPAASTSIGQSYTTGDDGGAIMQAARWESQTFLTGSNGQVLDRVLLKLYKSGNPGTFTVSIRATSGGLPTGGDLTSGTINGNTLTTSTSGLWYSIDLTNYTLTASTTYSILARIGVGDAAVYWRNDGTSPTYTDGQSCQSSDSGSTWAAMSNRDFMFDTRYDVSVPDNANNWTFLQNGVMPYMEYQEITIGGVQKQYIEWEYGATFTDQSGNGHTATPTFRTTSSDADVSASIIALTGIMETSSPSPGGQGGWTAMTTVPDAPEGLFTELDMNFFGAGYVQTFSDDTGIPLSLIVFPYAFGVAIMFGMIAWYISSGGGKKQHGRGSLLAMAAASLLVMVYFVYAGDGVIPSWVLIPFGIEALVFIVWRQTPSPY